MEEPVGFQSLESDTTEQLNNKNNWEDSTFNGAAEHVHHNYWACALQQEKPLQWEAHTPQ